MELSSTDWVCEVIHADSVDTLSLVDTAHCGLNDNIELRFEAPRAPTSVLTQSIYAITIRYHAVQLISTLITDTHQKQLNIKSSTEIMIDRIAARISVTRSRTSQTVLFVSNETDFRQVLDKIRARERLAEQCAPNKNG